MYFPKFWAQGEGNYSGKSAACWQWSDQSVDDARRSAATRAVELARKIATGDQLGRYGYGDRPLREEVLQRIFDPTGAETAVITRNRYGSLVLNAATTMFIDIDFPVSKPPTGFLARLMAKKQPHAPDPAAVRLAEIQNWVTGQNQLGMRVYRTAAGLRCLVTSRTFDPKSPETFQLLQSAGSDPLYVQLCKVQTCFRARLTPKPWRCAFFPPPNDFPREDPKSQARFVKWKTEYDQTIREYSVCQNIAHFGPQTLDPAIAPIVALHDQHACTNPTKPLA